MQKTAIDWTKAPKPWNEIGPRWAAETAKTAAMLPKLAPLPIAPEKRTSRLSRDGLNSKWLARKLGCSPSLVLQLRHGKRPNSKFLKGYLYLVKNFQDEQRK